MPDRTVAPELVIEVVSPNDRWIEIVDKLEEYFAIGVVEVWIADPRKQEIRIYYGLEETVRCIAPENLLRVVFYLNSRSPFRVYLTAQRNNNEWIPSGQSLQ